MCGIAGFSGDFDQSLLTRMQSAIAHRGPDDSGTLWIRKKSVGMAHSRLSIIDLSPLGHQPMWDATKSIVIVFNGEIYNYRELRDDLIKCGFVFNSHSDTEALLNLYLRDGKIMLDQLNGIFAFAIWDTRNDSLFLGRDGVGVKPLYYAETPKGFLFASELKAILQESSFDRAINPEAIHYYLTYLWSPAPHTMLNTIKKLEPGNAMTVKDGRVQNKWQFYDLPCNQTADDLFEEDAISKTQFHIRRAVERQMVSDVPVGAFLSGGLDSSAVVAMAKDISKERKLQCFTIGFKDDFFHKEGWVDDLPYAQRVAKHLGVDLHTIYVGSEMIGELEKMIYHLDEPQADPAPLNVLFICRLAREHGIKVLLSGAGGDDIFTGYRRHYALLNEKYWEWLPMSIKNSLSSISKIIPTSSPAGRRFSKAFQYADLDGNERLISYFYWINPEVLKNLYGPLVKDEINYLFSSNPLNRSLSNIPETVHPLNKMLYLEGKHFLADHNLNYTDKMSMAVGVEVRVPLLDPDLIVFASRLPIKFKQNGKTGKWIFKKSMEPYLPPEVIYRPKSGFGAPLRHWIKYELSSIVEDLLSESSLKKRGLFDPKAVKQIIESNRLGKIDAAYTIFSLMCIELWCRIFIDTPHGNINS